MCVSVIEYVLLNESEFMCVHVLLTVSEVRFEGDL